VDGVQSGTGRRQTRVASARGGRVLDVCFPVARPALLGSDCAACAAASLSRFFFGKQFE
jgi:hypothetical protein